MGLPSEYARGVPSLRTLDLEDAIGPYDRREVWVLADSGYDDTKIEQASTAKRWPFIRALTKTRSVTSKARYLPTPTSQQWCHIATFFRRHRRRKWDPMRLATSGNKRKRLAFRVRHTSGYLRPVGQVEWVGSEPRNRPDGRRQAAHLGARVLVTNSERASKVLRTQKNGLSFRS